MQIIGKISFVLAPICLFICFFSSAVLQNDLLKSIFIVLATIFLVLALIAKAITAQKNPPEEENES